VRSASWAEVTIVSSFAAFAAAYGIFVPPWEGPDEVAHFRYVEHLVKTRSLPVQRKNVFGEEHQAPLYYAIAALPVSFVDLGDMTGGFRWNRAFNWGPSGDINIAIPEGGGWFPLRGHGLALRLTRGVSIILASVTIALTFSMVQAILPQRPNAILLSGSLVAFNPQFLFISSVANNDNLLTLCWTMCLLQLVRVVSEPVPTTARWAWIGLWFGAALLAKASAVTLLPVVLPVLLLRLATDRAPKEAMRAILMVLAATAIVAGWWFARNLMLYGDPFGLTPFREDFGPVDPVGWVDLADVLATQFRSFWGVFGWMTVPSPNWFYCLTLLITLGGCAAVANAVLRRRRLQLKPEQKHALLVLALAIVVQEAFQLCASQTFGRSWLQGRYLFPALPAAAVLISVSAATSVSAGVLRFVAVTTASLLGGSAIYMLREVIIPAYEP
jgi:4-amino-4-deoxy-L-arabinose transferase-like glycosyltransferase